MEAKECVPPLPEAWKARVSPCPRAVVMAVCSVGAFSKSLEWGKVNSTYLIPGAGSCLSLVFSCLLPFFSFLVFFFPFL